MHGFNQAIRAASGTKPATGKLWYGCALTSLAGSNLKQLRRFSTEQRAPGTAVRRNSLAPA